jgi:hypothetical protein
MSERKLKSRKRKFSKGKRIAISDLVYAQLDSARRTGRPRPLSWDAYLRRICGFPNRKGQSQALVEGMLETTTGLFVLRLNGTTWSDVEEVAFKLATEMARKNNRRTISQPLKMRELR